MQPKEKLMRTILLAMLVAAGIGLVGTAGVSAMSINAMGLKNAPTDNLTQVQHWRWGSRRYRARCHYRWRSWGWC